MCEKHPQEASTPTPAAADERATNCEALALGAGALFLQAHIRCD